MRTQSSRAGHAPGVRRLSGQRRHAKRQKTSKNPRELAAAVVANLDLRGIAESVEIAGPGFINIRIGADQLAAAAKPRSRY
jgi:arginyl-tRNA synthetase